MKKLLLLLLVLSSFSAFSYGQNDDEEAICNQINDVARPLSLDSAEGESPVITSDSESAEI